MKDIQFLSYEEWMAQYRPVLTQSEPKLYDTNRSMVAIRLAPTDRVWTLIDEDGEWLIVNGSRFVNRLGYYITARPWIEGKDYQVELEKEDSTSFKLRKLI